MRKELRKSIFGALVLVFGFATAGHTKGDGDTKQILGCAVLTEIVKSSEEAASASYKMLYTSADLENQKNFSNYRLHSQRAAAALKLMEDARCGEDIQANYIKVKGEIESAIEERISAR